MISEFDDCDCDCEGSFGHDSDGEVRHRGMHPTRGQREAGFWEEQACLAIERGEIQDEPDDELEGEPDELEDTLLPDDVLPDDDIDTDIIGCTCLAI